MTQSSNASITRRGFLKGAGALAAAAGFPAIVPGTVFGADAPSNRVTMAFIGVGRQTHSLNLPQFMAVPGVQVLAVCDVDAWRMAQAKKQVETFYAKKRDSGKYKGCDAQKDFREVIARADVDAVMIATPDHWHVPIALAAIRAGKDVSCEKPLTISIREGRILADAVRKHQRVFRTDSEFRSLANFHRVCELVVNGRIGKLHTIRTGVPKTDITMPAQPEMPVPAESEKQDFIDAVRSRGATLEDAEVGHRTCSMCQIAHIAIQLGGAEGKKLRWDPEKERFDDAAANKLLDRPAWHEPWTLA